MKIVKIDQKSPRHLEVGVSQWCRQTDKQTDGQGDSMTELAHRADSVKTSLMVLIIQNLNPHVIKQVAEWAILGLN